MNLCLSYSCSVVTLMLIDAILRILTQCTANNRINCVPSEDSNKLDSIPVDSDSSLCVLLGELAMGLSMYYIHTAKAPVSLDIFPAWSESLLGTYLILLFHSPADNLLSGFNSVVYSLFHGWKFSGLFLNSGFWGWLSKESQPQNAELGRLK